ncbi:MAG: hypothetical protein EXR62_01530 [Chloroflexi bacterium]|nr:hypothetical protein [Chloroflexota bacterium]
MTLTTVLQLHTERDRPGCATQDVVTEVSTVTTTAKRTGKAQVTVKSGGRNADAPGGNWRARKIL